MASSRVGIIAYPPQHPCTRPASFTFSRLPITDQKPCTHSSAFNISDPGVSFSAPASSSKVKGYFLSLKGEKTMFKRNVGILDRIVRVALGIVLLPAGLFLLGGLQGSVLGLVVAGLGAIGLFTGFTGFCLLYILLGINTLQKEKELIDRFTSAAAGQMDRCMSRMAGFRQVPAGSGSLSAGRTCGPCSPSIGETPDQQG
jgi:hypothetical protein